jgi:hypothetical protein
MSIRVTTEVFEKLCKGYWKFYLAKIPRPTFLYAYERTLLHFFNIGYEMHKGQWDVIMPPLETLPSYRQFLYYRKRFELA